jgi:hypothetical protein
MKYVKLYEEFVNESWPFNEKRHISKSEEQKLSKYASKNSIFDDNNGSVASFVNDKKFQTNNEEKAWELFEIFTGAGNVVDAIKFAADYTWISHDELYAKDNRNALSQITDILVDMLERRSAQDVITLKKMKFLIN